MIIVLTNEIVIFRRIILYLIIISILNYTGCYPKNEVTKEEFFSEYQLEEIKQLTIVTIDDEKLIVTEVNARIINDSLKIEGINKTNTKVYNQPINMRIALNDIKYFEVREFNGVVTLLFIVGIILFFSVLLSLLLGHSVDKSPKSCRIEGLNDNQ